MKNLKNKLRSITQSFGRIKNKGIIAKYIVYDSENSNSEIQEYNSILPSLETIQETFPDSERVKIQIIDTSNNSILDSYNVDLVEEEEDNLGNDEETIMPGKDDEFDKRISRLEILVEKNTDMLSKTVDILQSSRGQSQENKILELLERNITKNPLQELEQLKKVSDLFNRPIKNNLDETSNRLAEVMMKAYIEQQSMERTMQSIAEIFKSPILGQLFKGNNSQRNFPAPYLGDEEKQDEFTNYLEQMNSQL